MEGAQGLDLITALVFKLSRSRGPGEAPSSHATKAQARSWTPLNLAQVGARGWGALHWLALGALLVVSVRALA